MEKATKKKLAIIIETQTGVSEVSKCTSKCNSLRVTGG